MFLVLLLQGRGNRFPSLLPSQCLTGKSLLSPRLFSFTCGYTLSVILGRSSFIVSLFFSASIYKRGESGVLIVACLKICSFVFLFGCISIANWVCILHISFVTVVPWLVVVVGWWSLYLFVLGKSERGKRKKKSKNDGSMLFHSQKLGVGYCLLSTL